MERLPQSLYNTLEDRVNTRCRSDVVSNNHKSYYKRLRLSIMSNKARIPTRRHAVSYRPRPQYMYTPSS